MAIPVQSVCKKGILPFLLLFMVFLGLSGDTSAANDYFDYFDDLDGKFYSQAGQNRIWNITEPSIFSYFENNSCEYGFMVTGILEQCTVEWYENGSHRTAYDVQWEAPSDVQWEAPYIYFGSTSVAYARPFQIQAVLKDLSGTVLETHTWNVDFDFTTWNIIIDWLLGIYVPLIEGVVAFVCFLPLILFLSLVGV